MSKTAEIVNGFKGRLAKVITPRRESCWRTTSLFTAVRHLQQAGTVPRGPKEASPDRQGVKVHKLFVDGPCLPAL